MTAFTFRRIDDSPEPTYEVRANGTVIGTVWRAWFRLGGDGWTYSGALTGTGRKTRLDAARALLKLYTRNTPAV